MKIGVLGLGFMGSTHLKAYRNIPQAEIAAVFGSTPQELSGDLSHIQGNLGGPGEKFDFSKVAKYSDPFAAVRDPHIEAVDLCVPTNFHAPLAIAALEAGKHVLVEKPLALSGKDCDAVLEAAGRSGRILMGAQVVRFLPAYAVTADMIRTGKLGAVRSAIFRRRCASPPWSTWLERKDLSGGGVFDLLIHDIDFCLHLFGHPEAVSATGYEDLARGLDWVAANLFYPNIGAVVVSGGWHHPKAFPFSADYTVLGDCGTVEFSTAGGPPTLYGADGTAKPLELSQTDGYEAELRYFVECCVADRQPQLCPPAESAAAVRLARQIDEARKRPGEKVECSL